MVHILCSLMPLIAFSALILINTSGRFERKNSLHGLLCEAFSEF